MTTEPVPSKTVAAVAEALIELGLRTAEGQHLWRGFLLGAGLPKGEGAICVREAVYAPAGAGAPKPGTGPA